MNDDVRFERLFADGLHESAPRRAPDRLRTTIKAQTAEVRPRARWWALIKEPTMRTNNRLAVGSPTARVAAIMAATLLAAVMIIGAGIAGAQLLAASGPIIVDASGGGVCRPPGSRATWQRLCAVPARTLDQTAGWSARLPGSPPAIRSVEPPPLA